LNIFLSYSWSNKDIADELDQDWSQLGLTIVRDIRDLKFKQNLKSFMKGITKTDYVITIISADYLKSKNCMFEALELMTDDKFKDKILPIVINDAKIYSTSFRIELIHYWENQAKVLQDKIREIPTLSTTPNLLKELKDIESIRNEIDEFINLISNQKYISWEDAKKTNYADLFKYLGLEHSEVFEKAISISKIVDRNKRQIELEKAIIKNPENIALQTLKAVLITKEGNYELGKELFSVLLERYPKENIFKFNLAVIEDQYFHNRKIAEKLYEDVVNNSPNYTDARVNLALIWIESGRNYDKARDHLQLSLYSNPDTAKALYNLGLLYSNHFENDTEAIKYLSWSIEVNPNFQEAITLKALIAYSQNSNLDTLISDLKTAVKIDDSSYYPQLVLGGQLHKQVETREEGMKYIETAKSILEQKIKSNGFDNDSKIPLAFILKNYYPKDDRANTLFNEGKVKRKDMNKYEL
jgi:tetratricopeptide (TPR) repeat protein